MKQDIIIMELKYKRIGYSLIGIVLCFGLTYFLYFNNKPDGKFGAAAIFLLVRYVALWIGLGTLIFRIISLIKHNDALVYIITGILNIVIAIIAIALFFSHHMITEILHLFLFNLLLGSIMVLDCLFFKKIF